MAEGWRSWYVKDTSYGWRLQGAHSMIWHSHLAKSDYEPGPDNTAGIYAYHSPPNFPSKGLTLGRCELGGTVITHTDNVIRGQYCRIKYLIVTNEEDANNLRPIYNVPLLILSLGDLLLTYMNSWEDTNKALGLLKDIPVEESEYLTPGEFRPPPVTIQIRADLGLTPEQIAAQFDNFLKSREKAKIKEASKRLNVSTEALQAYYQRYGILPKKT